MLERDGGEAIGGAHAGVIVKGHYRRSPRACR